MINVILCGGNGTRLWPISRTLFPKQFTKFEQTSLFQQTVLRNNDFASNQIIITNEEQQFLAKDQLVEIGSLETTFILEPVGRNTAAAIAIACNSLKDKEEIVLVTPSDHLIKNTEEYTKVIQKAEELATQGYIVTFGIKPKHPETGYGYIQVTGETVVSFKEKPNEEIAQQYVNGGNYYWNSGMFMFKASVFLQELEMHAMDVYLNSQIASNEATKNGEFINIPYEKMIKIPDISVDYAVMEKSELLKLIPSDIDWSDMGSFESLYENLDMKRDDNGNISKNGSFKINSKNNLIISEKAIATIDVEDLIVVDTQDALLISKQGSSHKVKEIVSQLKQEKPNLANVHLTAHRPWGVYSVLEESPGYKIKKIIVKPGKKLSLQKHHHRNEHWIVVSGTATVTIGEREFFVRPNESTYIKMGEVHRLENSGKIDLVLIEVQVGEYLEEDDIVRLEDDFRRN
ncbi:mannose-1-phosphate guanylyltransferase/mannose-6-phosphate isomerase [Lysinibacillus xylanilyticus]|uniref:mannose-1-phosphate guanylyltransferase/mannose-6-phosphate isomerase n=1 Tax=Lysinibacillus xylanilyticus TaxID=582475 RepID=UPI003827E423